MKRRPRGRQPGQQGDGQAARGARAPARPAGRQPARKDRKGVSQASRATASPQGSQGRPPG
ncbi:MAG: hypothetical protein E6J36_02015 [Chloroflexi bacterium]|nr:MAG: hypothetical protein E6J36_02015 [Chloroflexota bacterium]